MFCSWRIMKTNTEPVCLSLSWQTRRNLSDIRPSSINHPVPNQVHRAVEGWPSRNTPCTGHTQYTVVPHQFYSTNISFTVTANQPVRLDTNLILPGWLSGQVSTWCCTGVFFCNSLRPTSDTNENYFSNFRRKLLINVQELKEAFQNTNKIK